jgi:hypothetical protein
MKKADLEKQLKEYREMYIAKCSELTEQKRIHKVEMENLEYDIKEKAYEKWVSENGEFLKRFMKQYLMENMWFDENVVPYSDYTDIKLKIEDTTISQFSYKY